MTEHRIKKNISQHLAEMQEKVSCDVKETSITCREKRPLRMISFLVRCLQEQMRQIAHGNSRGQSHLIVSLADYT
jgi:hypothetical protein